MPPRSLAPSTRVLIRYAGEVREATLVGYNTAKEAIVRLDEPVNKRRFVTIADLTQIEARHYDSGARKRA